MYYVSPIPSLASQNIGTVLRSKFESALNRSEKAYTGKRSKFTQSHERRKEKDKWNQKLNETTNASLT